jgi:hypothetical protein
MPSLSLSQALELRGKLSESIDRAVHRNGDSTVAKKPAHRVKFHWPPHPISYSYHVLATEWTGDASFEAHGETFAVKVAKTGYGIFGRCEAIWHEDRGDTLPEMLANLRRSSEPLFQRQLTIHRTLERPGRFRGVISELEPIDLLKLLYCEDRDVAYEARLLIEARASSGVYLPSLLLIAEDRRHPQRRSAQWCMLDLFESLPSFCTSPNEERAAVSAIKGLLWDAEDDYARTVYKAGVVLGGHLPTALGGPALLECLQAPSKIGRRAAIHGLYHVVEWNPDTMSQVTSALRQVGETDSDGILREYARQMARDIEAADGDHVAEPTFPDEP